VGKLNGSGCFETGNINTLRIYLTKNMRDCAILAPRVHGLQYNQQTMLALRIKDLLQLCQSFGQRG
jgi:hypothetical protein